MNTSPSRPFQNAPGVDAQIQKHYPGMKAIAGPYAVNSTLPQIAKSEQASCVRALRDQRRNDPKAKIITYGNFAWVIRSAEGWQYDRKNEKFRDNVTGIKAGRAVKRS